MVFELFFRISEIQTTSQTRYDPQLGAILKSNMNYSTFTEGFSLKSTNEYGYLGPSYAPHKTSSTIRIALMGDSYTRGDQVFERHHFGSILEKQLNQVSDKKIEVMNFGMSSFTLNDSYCYYQKFASQFQADLILYVLGADDFYDHTKPALRSYCYLEDGQLMISDVSDSEALKSRLRTSAFRGKSAILNLINNCRTIIRQGYWKEVVFDKLYSAKNLPKIRKRKYRHRDVQLTEAILRDIGSDQKSYVIADENLPDTLRTVLARHGLPLIDVSDELDSLKRNGIDPYYWKATKRKGHWNHEAHKIIGITLAQQLSPLITTELEKQGK